MINPLITERVASMSFLPNPLPRLGPLGQFFRVLPRIWKHGVKIEDFINLGGRKLVTQFTRMIIATLYIDLAKQNVLLYVI